MTRDARAYGYRYMLAVIFVVYVLIIVITSPQIGGTLRVAILGFLLFQTLRTRRQAGKWIWPAVTLVLCLIGVSTWAAIAGSEVALICSVSASTGLLVAGVMLAIARPLLHITEVTGAAVRAVLCVYLLFALLFASIYQFFGAIVPDFLNGVRGYPTASDTLYFSVITLATVGYGDITPASSIARALVVAEALLGQLYLVSVVAAVVGRYRQPGT